MRITDWSRTFFYIPFQLHFHNIEEWEILWRCKILLPWTGRRKRWNLVAFMLTASGIFYDENFTRHLNIWCFSAFRFLYLYDMVALFHRRKSTSQDFFWDKKHHSCFMWINVLFGLRWRCFSVQMRKEILHTFIAMDDHKAERKNLHSILRK